VDALAVSQAGGVFGGKKEETGKVPAEGVGSTFEQGTLVMVIEDGKEDFGAAQEGDNYASVWQFSQEYRFIAVSANYTDPFVGDGFQSHDAEVDAVAGVLKPIVPPASP